MGPGWNKRFLFLSKRGSSLLVERIPCADRVFLQDKATSGKQGLGIKDQPRKVAGVRFQGKRTSFSDNEEGSESEEDCHPSTKRKFDDMSESQKNVESKPKLKKLCKKLLSQVCDINKQN